ncbi:MAG: hypothetical protein M3124_03590 [Actinomycetota bacterium]|nr:hypothetical protein [Actinomycetota bacterium]
MGISRIRRSAPKFAAFAYAGYKWFEDHTDEVERWSARAIERSRGKSIAKVVVPAAHLAQAGVKWMRENEADAQEPKSKQLPESSDTT